MPAGRVHYAVGACGRDVRHHPGRGRGLGRRHGRERQGTVRPDHRVGRPAGDGDRPPAHRRHRRSPGGRYRPGQGHGGVRQPFRTQPVLQDDPAALIARQAGKRRVHGIQRRRRQQRIETDPYRNDGIGLLLLRPGRDEQTVEMDTRIKDVHMEDRLVVRIHVRANGSSTAARCAPSWTVRTRPASERNRRSAGLASSPNQAGSQAWTCPTTARSSS